MNPDGSNPTALTFAGGDGCLEVSSADSMPDWSPDSQKLFYTNFTTYDEFEECHPYQTVGEIRKINRDGTGGSAVVGGGDPYIGAAVWSPDGNKELYASPPCCLTIENVNGGGGASFGPDPTGPNVDWQALRPPGYARPISASPTTVRLVPAYKTCTSSNSSHGAPLTAPSCNPPQQTSDYLTVGTADANGAPANSTGIVALKAICHPPDANGVPECPAVGDQIDVALTASLTDVRNKVGFSDYAGELRVSFSTRITDRLNGPGGVHPATASDTPIGFNMTCTPTADTSVGSTCSAQTSADAIMPGLALEGKRAVWELGQVQVYDGGADGDADTTGDNTLFVDQGLFAP
jgi:hypothetical protein